MLNLLAGHEPGEVGIPNHPMDITSEYYWPLQSLNLKKYLFIYLDFPSGSGVNNSPANAGDVGSIPVLGRSLGERNGNLLQYSCLGNPVDREPGGFQIVGSQKLSSTTTTIA